MSTVSHQTIKLSKGKHSSPQQGACVVELASMLAGEPFSDHPASVCPVIGWFLRAYNDAVDDERRQDLYACAAAVVGTNGPDEVRNARAALLADWTAQRLERRPVRFALRGLLHRLRLLERPPIDAAGAQAVDAIGKHTDGTHAEALALISDLVGISARTLVVSGQVGASDDARATLPRIPA